MAHPASSRVFVLLVCMTAFLLVSGCRYEPAQFETSSATATQAPADPDALAVLVEGMGDHEFQITTSVPEVQTFFNQALMMAYGFNHPGAERSFKEAARLDPDCAICWWGVSYVLGPNINSPMEPTANQPAWEALQKAVQLAPNASEREQAFIRALTPRYAENPPEDRASLDEAYADAMRALRQELPDDNDAAALFAEALMDLHPWDYWERNGTARPWTAEILQTLEWVMEADPRHPGAHHYYIHAVEASSNPDRGLKSAEVLQEVAPGVGHLVHMPAHIFIRTGRYHDASEANEIAIRSDVKYMGSCRGGNDTLYELAYVPHNWHFLWASTTMEGRSKRSLEAARRMQQTVNPQMMREAGLQGLQHYWVTPMFAEVRLGKWSEILARDEPDEDLVYPRGVWHYSRGMALASTGKIDEANAELAALKEMAKDPAIAEIWIWNINKIVDILDIAANVLEGEIARCDGRPADAIAPLQAAVKGQDALRYDEPPPFHFQVRQLLGVAMLEAGKPGDAEAVFREDLEFYPENGYSLLGLAQCLDAVGKAEEAADVRKRFEAAWTHADFEIASAWL